MDVIKRILHIAEASGGVERYLLNLLRKMKMYKEYEHILICSVSFDKKKFKGLVRAVIIVKEMENAISILRDSKAVFYIRKIIRKYKPDFVYCHSSKAGAIGRIADIGIRNKLIYNAHGWSFNMKGAGEKKLAFYKCVERFLAPLADKIVCISEYEKESALKHGICREDKLIVINSGIDYSEYKKVRLKTREELGIMRDAFIVGTIGRITFQKAPDIFVKMAVEVKKMIPEAFFLMVGDDIGCGTFRRKIEKQIQSVGLSESVMITGWVDNPLDYMGLFDIATLLSRWEGFGLVLPEYMYMGVPVIATKVDAIPYVVGDAGVLVNADDYRQAAESVFKLHENREFRDRMIEKGKERVKLFDAQRSADEHVKNIFMK